MIQQTCCGFGHRLALFDVSLSLRSALIDLIEEKDVTVFLTGGMGEFDDLFSATVCSLRKEYPNVRLNLVCPYFSKKLNDCRTQLNRKYDEIIIPAELDGVYKKAAIPKRNRWMIDQSDFVVSAVYRDFGGAFEALTYAKKGKKEIIYLL